MFQEEKDWGAEKRDWCTLFFPSEVCNNSTTGRQKKRQKKKIEKKAKVHVKEHPNSIDRDFEAEKNQCRPVIAASTAKQKASETCKAKVEESKDLKSTSQKLGVERKKRKRVLTDPLEKYCVSKKLNFESASANEHSICQSKHVDCSLGKHNKFDGKESVQICSSRGDSHEKLENGIPIVSVFNLKKGRIPFLLKRDEIPSRTYGKSHGVSLKAMRERLESGRFRYINEQLYTSHSEEAVKLFAKDERAFKVYHMGYQCQIAKWPQDPLEWIRKRIPSKAVVADFGCGDARLSSVIPNKTHSFDLVAVNDRVTVCDMAHVPLSDGAVDIAVFCLSLMGTNITDFLREARRVLKNGGKLLIAEVISRFDNVNRFTKQVSALGFLLQRVDESNKMFVEFEFSKSKVSKKKETINISLLPCIYKKR